MNKTTMPGVTISRVKRTHAWRLYLWPFQSWRALRSFLVWLTFALSIIGTIKYMFAPAGTLQVLICAAIGGLVGAYGALPARLTLATRGEARHAFTDLQAQLVKLGYVASDQPGPSGNYYYRSKMPRWLICDSQDNLKLVVHDREIVLTGPIASLFLLRAKLLQSDDHAYLKA